MASIRTFTKRLYITRKQCGHLMMSQQQFSSVTLHLNTLKDLRKHTQLNNAKEKLNDLDHKTGTRLPIAIPQNVNTDIKICIDAYKNGKDIVSLIQRNQKRIQHASIYGKAMQKCKNVRDFECVHKLMNMLLHHSDLEIGIVEFTIYMNSMALGDHPKRCLSSLYLMVSKYGIKPNEITFGTLMKSFRGKSQYKEAEKLWDLMKNRFHLKPNETAYTAMMTIYAEAYKKDKAHQLLQDYLHKLQHDELAYCGIFGAYVSVFAKCADIEGMKEAIRIGMKYGMELKPYLVGTIMSGYYSARKFKKCVQILDRWIAGNGNKATHTLMFYKSVALSAMIKSKHSLDEKEIIYKQLLHCLYYETRKFDIKLDPMLAKIQLSAAIFCYQQHDPLEIVDVFESLLDKQLIGYMSHSDCIDIHIYEPWEAQFIIRYLIGFRLKEILRDNDKIRIITGKGIHTRGGSIRKGKLYNLIAKELLSWQPAIKHDKTENLGRLCIDKQQLLPYLNEDNFAKRKLSVASDDWYDYDPRTNMKHSG